MLNWLKVRAWTVLLSSSIAVLCAQAARAAVDDRKRPHDVINDLVAVGIAENGRAVVLATPALPARSELRYAFKPAKAKEWRYRVLPLRPESTEKMVFAAVSASGTKLIALLEHGRPIVVDLTDRVFEIPTAAIVADSNDAIVGRTTHHLGDELIPIIFGRSTDAPESLGVNETERLRA